MPDTTIYFAYPGDLDTATGGYRYDRQVIAELRVSGLTIETLSLPHLVPHPSQANLDSVAQTLAGLPDDAVVIIDGLAFGVMHAIAEREAQRLRLLALCHHPLALESGLGEAERQALFESERRALACTRAIIVTSEHTRQLLVEQFAVPAGRITVALPGTEAVAFAACDGDPLRLLTVATLTRRKGHDVLLEALSTLIDLPWQARFVGGAEFDSTWAAELQTRTANLGLRERICFAGAVDSTLAEYPQADVFVLPSRFEGYGMVFAEALAAGLPVVATRAGAVPDVVPDSAGILVPPDDSEALSAALREVLTDKALRAKLQAGARQAAAQLPGWADSAATVAKVLTEVASA